jgi:transposase
MQEHTTIPFPHPQLTAADPFTEVLRQGAQRLLAQAIEVAVAMLLAQYAPRHDAAGRQAVVRNGFLPERDVHFDTTSITVYRDYPPPEEAEESARPFRITYGYSKDKRPDLKQFVLSTLCGDRTVPLWGKPEDGNASDKTVNNTLLSGIATFLVTHWVAAGAYISVADAALVTEENFAALGDTLFITRLPATYNECGRLITEVVAHNAWGEVGVLAHTKLTKHRPAYKAAEGEVSLYGRPYRAVVVHSSAQDKRQ